MSYRTFKHLLGETSLERKCRFIFGGGILILVTLSFYWYGRKTESLVIGQNTESARNLVHPVLAEMHLKLMEDKNIGSLGDELIGLAPKDESPLFEYHVLLPETNDPKKQPASEFEGEVLQRFVRAAKNEAAFAKAGNPRRAMTFSDGTEMFDSQIIPGKKGYQYIQAVTFKPSCLLACHGYRMTPDGVHTANRAGDLAAALVIELPMERVNKAIHRNRAILITAALVTAILAMVASATIFRYVIVKPVSHLREVSDAIAAGKLTVRSQIHTGDEFEELSHAFNRMLHNLVAMQQELRDVNGDLDRKVDELAQANLALFESNRIKSEFLTTMSHELRTPLNSIIGFSEVLSGSDHLNEKQRRYAVNIQASGRMLLAMINDVLDLARIESGKMEVRAEDFSIRDVCEAVAATLRESAEKKSIDLITELDEAVPLLRQDPGKIRQIIINLVGNAIKFTPEGGRVLLRAYPEGQQVVIQVVDNGIGIAPEDRDSIFEKFRQAAGRKGSKEGVLIREHQGTGLGLSIVRELCKLMGGDIALESELGLGSTFTVRLPMQVPGNRRFEVTLADEGIDLSKARRVEMETVPRPAGVAPHLGLGPLPAVPARKSFPGPSQG